MAIPEVGAKHWLYRGVFRHNSVFFTTVFAVALVGEHLFSKGMDRLWYYNNRGRLFNDLQLD